MLIKPRLWFSPFALAVVMLALAAPAVAQKSPPDLTKPQEKLNDERFAKMHKDFVDRAKKGDVDLLFLGDSITAGWITKAKELFHSEYEAKYKTANFGIGGDHVNGVLWRVHNGEFDGIKPKVVVLMIGTNDTGLNSADDIAAGVKNLIGVIQEKSPSTKVLLLGMLPRGPRTDKAGKVDDGIKRMQVIRDANPQLAKLDNGSSIRYLDMGHKFVDASGKIPAELMADQLHPSKKGYEIWVEAMRPLLSEMMK